MFVRHSHFQMQELFAQLLERLRPQLSPFQSPVVLVPSTGLARWLQLKLATELGLCGGIQFPFASSWLWSLQQKLLTDDQPATALNADTLATAILAAIMRHAEDDRANISRVQAGRAVQVADLLDRYLVYKPELLLAWQSGEPALNSPVAQLWTEVMHQDSLRPHRASKLGEFYHRLASTTTLEQQLPGGQLHLFCLKPLPPAQQKIIDLLSAQLEVHSYDFDAGQAPESSNTGQFPARTALAALRKESPASGAQKRVPAETLLGTLQQAHRCNEPLLNASMKVDSSLQFHRCHGELREVEELQEALLRLLHKRPKLRPDQILVQCADVTRYLPALQQVFNPESPSWELLPMALPGQARTGDSIQTLLRLILQLPLDRLSAARLFEWLEIPALCRRLGLGPDEKHSIRELLTDSGLRWGLDATHRNSLNQPAYEEQSWLWLLERLIKGLAAAEPVPGAEVHPEQLQTMGDGTPLLPISSTTSADRGLRSGLIRLLQWITEWQQLMLDDATLAQRCETLTHILTDALNCNTSEDEERADWIRKLEILAVESRLQQLDNLCDPAALAELLFANTEKPGSRASLLDGRITVAEMTAVTGVPAPVIAILGMEDGIFPRKPSHHELQETTGEDPSPLPDPRREDLALFESAFQHAGSHFLLFWSGRDPWRNREKSAALPVQELLAEAQTLCNNPLQNDHALQPWHPDYFNPGNPLFCHRHELAGSIRGTEQQSSFKGLNPECTAAPFMADNRVKPAPELKAFFGFWQHPVRAYLREGLGIQLPRLNEESVADESFRKQGLQGWGLDHSLLKIRKQLSPDESLRWLRAQGLVPGGKLGETLYRESRRTLEALKEQISREFPHGEPALHRVPLRGTIKGIPVPQGFMMLPEKGEALVVLSVSKNPKPRVLQNLWLQHLLRHACTDVSTEEKSVLIYPDGQVEFTVPENPAALLKDWLLPLQFRDQSLIPYDVRLTFPWLQDLKKDLDPLSETNRNRLESIWHGTEYDPSGGLKSDAWLHLCWGDSGLHGNKLARQAALVVSRKLLIPLLSHLSKAKKKTR